MRNYYRYLDEKIGEILEKIDENTKVMVVSDHGAKAIKGLISVNMALEKLGLLKFKKKPKCGTRINDAEVDWSKTYAWGWGGYYARIFLNVEGREAEGIIKKEDYDELREEIANKIKTITDNKGKKMNTQVYKPEDLYPIIRGDAPDLIVYFAWQDPKWNWLDKIVPRHGNFLYNQAKSLTVGILTQTIAFVTILIFLILPRK